MSEYMRRLSATGRRGARPPWRPLTQQDVAEAESMAVQVLPPAIAMTVILALRLHGKDAVQFGDPRSDLARLVRDIRWLALGDVPGSGPPF